MLHLSKLLRTAAPGVARPRAYSLLAWLGPTLLGALTLFALARSAHWPLVLDSPLMHFIAAGLLAGEVPYRDLADMNMPGTYLLHMLILSTLGGSDAAWRVFDILCSLLTAASIYSFCRPFSRPIAACTGLLFILYHLMFGPQYSGQRDYVIAPLLVFALALHARVLEGSLPSRALLLTGMLVGLAGTIKPYTCILLALLIVVQLLARRQRPAVAAVDASLLAAGAALPIIAVSCWLAAIGGLGPLISFNLQRLLPLYSQMKRLSPLELAAIAVFKIPQLAFLLPLPLALRTPFIGRPRYWLAWVGALYGLAHFMIQNKGWGNHLYPLNTFLLILAGISIAAALQAGGARRVLGALCLVALAGTIGAFALQSVLRPRTLATEAPLVAPLMADLQGLQLVPGETVQVMDSVEGGIHALFKLGLRQPTRFVYDFFFFYAPELPLTQQLREELIQRLGQQRPAAIVVLSSPDHPSHEAERLRGFPALVELLGRDYAVAADRYNPATHRGYVLYVLRDRGL
jgi:hypothetical protein